MSKRTRSVARREVEEERVARIREEEEARGMEIRLEQEVAAAAERLRLSNPVSDSRVIPDELWVVIADDIVFEGTPAEYRALFMHMGRVSHHFSNVLGIDALLRPMRLAWGAAVRALAQWDGMTRTPLAVEDALDTIMFRLLPRPGAVEGIDDDQVRWGRVLWSHFVRTTVAPELMGGSMPDTMRERFEALYLATPAYPPTWQAVAWTRGMYRDGSDTFLASDPLTTHIPTLLVSPRDPGELYVAQSRLWQAWAEVDLPTTLAFLLLILRMNDLLNLNTAMGDPSIFPGLVWLLKWRLEPTELQAAKAVPQLTTHRRTTPMDHDDQLQENCFFVHKTSSNPLYVFFNPQNTFHLRVGETRTYSVAARDDDVMFEQRIQYVLPATATLRHLVTVLWPYRAQRPLSEWLPQLDAFLTSKGL